MKSDVNQCVGYRSKGLIIKINSFQCTSELTRNNCQGHLKTYPWYLQLPSVLRGPVVDPILLRAERTHVVRQVVRYEHDVAAFGALGREQGNSPRDHAHLYRELFI